MTLDQLPDRVPATVRDLQSRLETGDPTPWLRQLGFLPGEPVTVIRRAWPGHDPLVVRIAASTFALRRAEAACILVDPLP